MEQSSSQGGFSIKIEGVDQRIVCSTGQTVLQALTGGGAVVEANCGGRGTCKKCRYELSAGSVVGQDGLPAEPLQDNIYLSCGSYPASDLAIRLNKKSVSAKGDMTFQFELDGQPLLRKISFTPDYPTVEQHYSLQKMLKRSLPQNIRADNKEFLEQLAAVIESEPPKITAVLSADKLITVEAGDTVNSLYGLAYDIGTTTVVGLLVDINARKVVASASETNPQATFGADVISRIEATEDSTGLTAQAKAIRQCLDRIAKELCGIAKIETSEIYGATIAGNSTMEHLLLEVSPLSLVRKPYASVFGEVEPFLPREINLGINPLGRVILLPNIASFIGADTTAAILAAGQDVDNNQSLMVDLGTNGEMALGNSAHIFACSTAAGPAFEGAHIRDGMRAAPGAIEDVIIGQDVQVKTIGDSRPTGICGSGIIKAIAEMVRSKIILLNGRFNKATVGVLPAGLIHRLKKTDGQWEFVLVDGANSATGSDISITQSDIRQIQLVKSAICSGIQILMDQTDVKKGMPVYLAGAFGNYIDIESALTIGMLPGFKREQVKSIGNAAGVGAAHALLSREHLERCYRIASTVRYVELAARPDFQRKFLANLAFPETADSDK